ncbi:PaaI family thioesterase [Geodermatophilus sp. SYSU D00758]
MSAAPRRPPVAGDPAVAARVAAGSLADVPLEVLRAGLRLPLHDHLGIELVGLDPVRVDLPLTDRTRTATGPLHGGALAALVDVAGNVAAATSGAVDVTRSGLVTARAEIDFRGQPAGRRVRAEAGVLEAVRRTVRTTVEVRDEGGRLVGRAVVTSRVLPGAGVPGTGLGDGAC